MVFHLEEPTDNRYSRLQEPQKLVTTNEGRVVRASDVNTHFGHFRIQKAHIDQIHLRL
jgi:hypothetical protein